MIYIHRHASILSAYGLRKAKLQRESKRVFISPLDAAIVAQKIRPMLQDLALQNTTEIMAYNPGYEIVHKNLLSLKYVGSDYLLTLTVNENCETIEQ